ncbi:hypothetical protein ACOMHN_062088 [Nucella lapillus]
MAGRGLAGRFLLTGLYLSGGLSAGAALFAMLIEGAQGLNCLPPVTGKFGDPGSVKDALGAACDVIMYSTGTTCGVCLFLAMALNCCWGHWGWSVCHQVMTLALCVLSTACGTALTFDFILWCRALQDTTGRSSCQRAASAYDAIHQSTNMTAYFSKMEMQQASWLPFLWTKSTVCQWAVVPFLLCAAVACSVVMKASATEPRPHPATGRYFLLPDESAPLLVAETSLEQQHPSEGPRGAASVTG